ncbi:hypothetical protein [Streptococcus sobrinus]|uniref:hypothetical protein n=1 Tax=Streptococcus sobrinus TaxID=1310 RepID=UPI000318A49E|nr:hypothetical protein [Streptococcus sobrinus]
MSQRKKNTLQRLLVILVLLVSLGLFAWLCTEVWQIKNLAENLGVHFTNRRGKLAELDSPVQKLIFIFTGWLVLQIAFFIGLLNHFFKSTKNDSERGSRRAEEQRKSNRYESEDNEDDADEERDSRRHHRSRKEDKDEDNDFEPLDEGPKRRQVSAKLNFDEDTDTEESVTSNTVHIEVTTPQSSRYEDDDDEEDYLEVPKPVGRRSRKDRR